MCLCICVQIQHYTRNVLCDLIFVWLCEGKKNHCVWFHFIFIVRADAVFLGAVWAVSCFCFSSLLSIWLLLSSLLPTENWCSRCSSSRRRGSLIAWKLDFAAEWQKLLMIGEADREKQSDLTASYGEKEQKWKTNLRFSSHTNPRLGLKPLWMSRVRLLHLFTWAYVRLSTCLYPQCFSVLLHTPLFGWVRDSGAPLKRKQRLSSNSTCLLLQVLETGFLKSFNESAVWSCSTLFRKGSALNFMHLEASMKVLRTRCVYMKQHEETSPQKL